MERPTSNARRRTSRPRAQSPEFSVQRCLWRAASAGLFLCCCVSVAGLINLLPDGGFEQEQWTLTTWDHGEAKHEFTPAARTGERSVKLTGISGEKARINVLGYSPAVDVEAGREYTFSVWYRTEGTSPATLSLLAYSEPWSTAQWKTPSTAYWTRRLPDSASWRPYVWRFTVPVESVQLIAAVRCGGKGTVWYDDAALFEAQTSNLDVAEPGLLIGWPDRRQLRFAVSTRGDVGDWRVTLLGQGSAQSLGAADGSGTTEQMSLEYSGPAGRELLAALEDVASGAVLATADVAVPPVVDLRLMNTGYRNSVYLSLKQESVRATLDCAVSAELRAGMRFAAGFGDEPAGEWQPLERCSAFTVPVPQGVSGELTLHVRLQGVPDTPSLSRTLKVVPPAPAGTEVVIGEHSETLVDGKVFFPAGFFGMPADTQADPIAASGYTAALTYGSGVESGIKWLDYCQQLGLLGMVSVPRPFVDKFDEEKLRAAIRAVRHHPALLGYYLFDEPSPAKEGQTPADLKRVYDVVADEDPYHPVGVCINRQDVTDDYSDCFDVVLPDPYPLVKTVRPLTYVSDRVDVTRELLAGRKPVWIVPQAFGWDVIKGIDDPERYRTPSPAQERCMTYLALVRGVQGVLYYCYHVYTGFDAERKKAGKWPYILGGYLPDQQVELWGSLAELGVEMKAFGTSLLERGATCGNDGSVFWRITGAGAGGRWLLAVNAGSESSVSTLVPAQDVELTGAELRFGNGKVALTGAGISLHLPALGTLAALLKP